MGFRLRWRIICLGVWMIADCCPECEDTGRTGLHEIPSSLPSMLELMHSTREVDVPCPYCKRSDYEEWARLHWRLYFGT